MTPTCCFLAMGAVATGLILLGALLAAVILIGMYAFHQVNLKS